MPERPTLAREFYDSIAGAADPVAAIRQLYAPEARQVETDYLDFKNYEPRALKDQFRQALCGFSNNQGGVLIWGIDARPQGDPPVDAACGEKLIARPRAVASRLLELQNGGVDPPVANVQVQAIEAAPGEGFVIAYIPDGPFKPYRATDGLQTFWFRSGWSFIPMATSMVRQLFFPRSQAVFRVTADLDVNATVRRRQHLLPGNNACFVCMELALENIGGSTAANAVVEASITTDAEFDPDVTPGKTWRLNAANAPVYIFRSRRRIHPQQMMHLAWADWDIPTGSSVVDCLGKSPQLRISVYCENQEPQNFFAEVSAAALSETKYMSLTLQIVDAFPRFPNE